MKNLFSSVQIELLSLPGSQQAPVVGVRCRIAWYWIYDMIYDWIYVSSPHAYYAFIIHCLLLSPSVLEKWKDRGHCLVFPGWWKSSLNTSLPMHCVLAVKTSCEGLSAALPAQPNRGPGLLSIIPAQAGNHVLTTPHLVLWVVGGWACIWVLPPPLRETSIPVQLGPLGWGGKVYILVFGRNAQALPHSFGCWYSSHCPEFTLDWVFLIWFGLVGKEKVGWSNPCGPWVTLLVLYSSTWCFSLALLASPAHAAGGVGALSNAWLRGGVTEALPRSAVPSGTQERLHHQFLTFSHLEQLLTCWVYHVLTQPTKAWY